MLLCAVNLHVAINAARGSGFQISRTSRSVWGFEEVCRPSEQSLVVSILRSLTMRKFHVVRTLLAISSLAAIVVDLGAGHKFFGA